MTIRHNADVVFVTGKSCGKHVLDECIFVRLDDNFGIVFQMEEELDEIVFSEFEISKGEGKWVYFWELVRPSDDLWRDVRVCFENLPRTSLWKKSFLRLLKRKIVECDCKTSFVGGGKKCSV